MDEIQKLEQIKQFFPNVKAIFGIIIDDKGQRIIGLGVSNHEERSLAILSLRKLSDTLEENLFKDYDGELHKKEQ